MISAAAVARPSARNVRARSLWSTLIAASLSLLILGASCSGTEPIERLTIVNRTEYDVEVMLSDAEKESWLILGQASHESSTVNELVTDVGPTWVFRFHYGGRDVGDVTIERDDLRRAQWRIEVPSAVADRMKQLGFEPPPDG